MFRGGVQFLNLEFMPTKDKFPDHLENLLNTYELHDYQLYTDEIVLNSNKVK